MTEHKQRRRLRSVVEGAQVFVIGLDNPAADNQTVEVVKQNRNGLVQIRHNGSLYNVPKRCLYLS